MASVRGVSAVAVRGGKHLTELSVMDWCFDEPLEIIDFVYERSDATATAKLPTVETSPLHG